MHVSSLKNLQFYYIQIQKLYQDIGKNKKKKIEKKARLMLPRYTGSFCTISIVSNLNL